MARSLLLAGTATVLLLCPGSASAAGCPGADTRLTDSSAKGARAAILCLVNDERTARGLAALSRSGRLEVAAQLHSDDMVAKGFFDHVNREGLDPFGRLDLANYAYAAAAENIAAGQRTPRAAMEVWMASEEHCRNILGAGFTELGVGANPVAATLPNGTGTWTQNLGRPAGAPHPAGPQDAAGACPVVSGLATPAGEGGTTAGDAAGGSTGDPADGGAGSSDTTGTGAEGGQAGGVAAAASTAGSSKLIRSLRRTSRRIVVRGQIAAPDGTRVRVKVLRGGRKLARGRARVRNGRYVVRVRTRAGSGRVKVVTRVAGQRAARTSTGR